MTIPRPLVDLLAGKMHVKIDMAEVLGGPETYRGPFGQWARLPHLPHRDKQTYKDCSMLQNVFGGPPCDVEDLMSAVCRAQSQQSDYLTYLIY